MDLQDITLVCHDCKKEYVFSAEEQEEFLAQGRRHPPKRCPECREARAKRKAARQENSNQGYNNGPRKMYQIVCSECGKETQVPFEPKAGRPVYCSECYHKVRRENQSSN